MTFWIGFSAVVGVAAVLCAFCLGAYLEFKLHKPICNECDDYRARRVVERR